MRIAIIGGHLAPALAVIDDLPKETQVLFIGRKHTFEGDRAISLEYNTIKSLKIPFASISTGRLQRKFTKYTIPSLFKIPYGFIQSLFILLDFKPDVVLGFGGYLSLSVGLAAFILKIPIIIHEQTLEAGIANRILSIFAKRVCISWESSFKYFPRSKTVLIGNPIRNFQLSNNALFANDMSLRGAKNERRSNPQTQEIAYQASLDRNDKNNKRDNLQTSSKNLPVIYVTGGSSGSHFINTLVESCIKQLLEQFVVIHQTGDAQEYHDFYRLNKIREALPSSLKTRYILIKFINPQDVGLVLQKVDMVVGRAGINTVTELIYFNKPTILIPIPFGQNKEQQKNAFFFKSLGLGEVLLQESLSPLIFLQKIRDMVNNINKYRKRHSGNQAEPKHPESPAKSDSGQLRMTDFENAAKNIIEVIEYVKKNKKG